MNEKADYQDVCNILPFEGEEEIHESCFLPICKGRSIIPQGLTSICPKSTGIGLARFILECKCTQETFNQFSVVLCPLRENMRHRIMGARHDQRPEVRGQMTDGRTQRSDVRGQ